MDNDVYQLALTELRRLLGAPVALESGAGARFQNSSGVKATIYHRSIAPGNQAELAVEPGSFAAVTGLSQEEAREQIAELASISGRDVALHPTYRWPRVGFANREHVVRVVARLQEMLGAK